jgi:SnoaL-like polyketide cyclase
MTLKESLSHERLPWRMAGALAATSKEVFMGLRRVPLERAQFTRSSPVPALTALTRRRRYAPRQSRGKGRGMTGDAEKSRRRLDMHATGKSAAWDEVHIGRLANGKLAEHRAVIDQLGMLQQLGLAPGPGAPA